MKAVIRSETEYFAECPECGHLNSVEVYTHGRMVCEGENEDGGTCGAFLEYSCPYPEIAEPI